ncbi:MAG: hypothetical protein IKX00_04345 [Bacilli bacterium]|nr:hypothetical protein [Bacilli bacterium]
MEQIFDDIDKYEQELLKFGYRLDDVEFIKKDSAIVSSLGIQELDPDALVIPENYVKSFDLNKPYKIYTNDLYQITKFVCNITDQDALTFVGDKASTPFYQFVAASRTLNRKAHVTDLINKQR